MSREEECFKEAWNLGFSLVLEKILQLRRLDKEGFEGTRNVVRSRLPQKTWRKALKLLD